MVSWYDAVARLDHDGELLFMNHGYQSEAALDLPAELEPYRYPIQLYDLLGREVDWANKDALEVSSGLGGGTVWISRRYSPRTLCGLDLASRQVRKCQQRFGLFGINYTAGDAQAMPFPDANYDIVLNVESSLNYPNFDVFLGEVFRVLRPGGYFLFADYRRTDKLPRMKAKLLQSRMEVIWLRDITSGIIAGMEKEDIRKAELIERKAPRLLAGSITNFAGLGAGKFNEKQLFTRGEKTYIAAILRKPQSANGGGLGDDRLEAAVA